MTTKVKLGDVYGHTTTAAQVQRAHHNLRNATVNLATVRMPAAAGETVRYYEDGEYHEVTVWSPGPDANTVWATTPDRRYVLVHYSRRSDEWFKDGSRS